MNAIIIDDEENGRKIVSTLLQKYCKDVTVLAMACSADEGYAMIMQHTPDIIFLDIEMPNGNGFCLLEKFREIPFQVVFTTAYDNHSIKIIRFHALDYLLKPIDIDELKQVVEKVKTLLKNPQNENRYTEFLASRRLENSGRIGLPVEEGVIFLPVSDIVQIESTGTNCRFHMEGGEKYNVFKNIDEYEDLLPESDFFRAQRSLLINLKKIRKYSKNESRVEMNDGALVELTGNQKEKFLRIMKEQK